MTLCLYASPVSGHCHRVELFLRLLGLPFRHERVMTADTKTPDYLAVNPFGQIPALQDDDVVLCDSNAILIYLALKYDLDRVWYPADPLIAGQVQRWLSLAAGEVRYGPALVRSIRLFGNPSDLAAAQKITQRFLGFMESHLANRTFLAHTHATIADLSCYAYVAHAPEGGVDLTPFPHIRAWLGRIEALPGFHPMQKSVPAV